jgi:DNA-binding transcriptional MerR regulator
VLGVSVGTMRNWSDQYADYLSETARPGHLPERRFTEHDITILTYVKQLRGEGMQAEQIRTRLDETEFIEGEIIQQQAPTEANKHQQPTAALTAQTSPDVTTAPPAVIVALDDLQRRFEALERSIESIKQERRHVIYQMALGFLTACGLFLILLLLAVLYGGFR